MMRNHRFFLRNKIMRIIKINETGAFEFASEIMEEIMLFHHYIYSS